ncbi:MAG TPA: MBL fold metallo-hydrolase [Clostridiales bacterium]|nr:MBL fold metallo-hydrolase [Clostridiales bacterium]
MKLTFIGAAHEVTGSCFFLEACGKNILVDCGMEQGRDVYVNQEIPVASAAIDAVLLTHAHMDHSGLLPLLYAEGFRGSIHATSATSALCNIMLRDSAHIQMSEAEWKNRKRQRSGAEPAVPLYDMEAALSTIRLFAPHEYSETFTLFEGIEVRFTDVGHLLGSASIEVWITEEGVTKKIVFSGDIGNLNQPLIKDPQYIKEADYVIMESTYGDRNHGESPDYIGELTDIIQTTFDRGGNVIIPSFAVGRTQVLLYYLRKIKDENLVKGHPNFKVYVDSPLAVEATGIFREYMAHYFDEEAMALVRKGINPLSFPGLKTSITSEESKAINFDEDPKVIISASGMCDAGRIRHHLKHNLWRKDSTVLFVGFQAEGTLGRILLDGVTQVKLFGEEITVEAEIRKLAGVSGHADRDGLLKWLTSFEKKPERVFVVHGDEQICQIFTDYIRDELGYAAVAPYSGAAYDLIKNACVQEGRRIPAGERPEAVKAGSVFDRLVQAGKRLAIVIQHNKGGANKDLARFLGQINSLCDKWDR